MAMSTRHWLVIASPIVASPLPCITFRCTAASRIHPQPPLFVRAGWLLHRILLPASTSQRTAGSRVASRHLHLTSASSPSRAPPFSSPLSRRRGHRRHPQMHGALSRRRHRQWPLFPLIQLLSSNTSACAPATCSLLRHLRLTSTSSPSLAPPFSSPPLSAPRPLPASSNARHTLPEAALPTATVPSCTALVIQHVHLRRRIVIFTAQPSTILAQLSSYLGGR